MEEKVIKEMLLDIISEVDYDISKEYVEATAEEPECVEDKMNILVDIVKKYLK